LQGIDRLHRRMRRLRQAFLAFRNKHQTQSLPQCSKERMDSSRNSGLRAGSLQA
jgi:hypothetical protein